MGLAIFREHFIHTYAEVEKKTVQSIIQLIQDERRGETVDRTLLKEILRMFTYLQVQPM
jgi:cullin-4